MADNKDDSLISSNNDFERSMAEVELMSDEELYQNLKSTGKDVGPVVETTRRLYQKQLATLWSSPNGNVRKSQVTNGNGVEELNGNGSESDDETFETSSRASHSSRASSSVAKKSRASSNSKILSANDSSSPAKSDDAESPRTRSRYSSFDTPTRPSRTFEEYVAESEARKATQSDTYLRRQNSVERSGEETAKGSGILDLKLALLLAAFIAILAYIYVKFGTTLLQAPRDREAIIDEEIEKLTQQTS